MLLTMIENWMVDDMTNKQIRYIEPVLANKPTTEVSEIYAQIRRDFQLVPPLTLFSPSSKLLAGVWNIWRESQFVSGKTPRSTLEAVAAAISSINACPYCVDAHTGMLHATSRHDVVTAIFSNDTYLINDYKTRQIVEWALSTKTPEAEILKSPPFTTEEAPEIIGTAIVYHFVNRMVNIFLDSSPLPVPNGVIILRKIAVRIFGATLAKRIIKRKAKAGESTKFVSHSELPLDMHWAIPNIHIATAYASFTDVIEQLGQIFLSHTVRQTVKKHIDLWKGEDMGIGQGWVNKIIVELDNEDKPAAKLALLTALSPYQVDEKIINEFRARQPTNEALLSVTAWASFTTARRVGNWMWQQ